MINNQIQTPAAGSNTAVQGKPGDGSGQKSGNQQGGLFKLMMSAAQGGALNGKPGSTGANILGGNLTLNSGEDNAGKKTALELLSGSGEDSKEETSTISKLLDGSADESGNTTESESTESDTSLSKEAKSLSGSGSEIEKESNEQSSNPDVLGADGEVSTATDEAEEIASTVGQTVTDPQVSEQVKDGATIANDAVSLSGNGIDAQQQMSTGLAAEASVKASDQASVKDVEASKGNKSLLFNKLFGGQELSPDGKQGGPGAILNGGNGSSGNMTGGVVETDGEAAVNLRGEFVKSEGLVKELQALAAAKQERLAPASQQERLQASRPEGAADIDLGETEEVLKDIFTALQTGSVEQIAAELRSLKANQIKEARYSNYLSSFANRQEIANRGSAMSLGGGSSQTSAGLNGMAATMSLQSMIPTEASLSSDVFDENGAVLWKEQITEYFESQDKSKAENQAAAAFARLGDVPVTNINVRRSFAKGISQAILSSTSNGSKGSEVWQKHNFVLEDGKNIQVAAREVEGVLQLKLSSSYSELNKLLMQHENEIRDLLENELELTVDLQMDGGSDSNAAGFFGGSSDRQSGSNDGPLDLGSLKKTAEKPVEEVLPKAVRKFGYNQMEWTV